MHHTIPSMEAEKIAPLISDQRVHNVEEVLRSLQSLVNALLLLAMLPELPEQKRLLAGTIS
ncbi:hypothetical protein [Paraburkholderia phenazinium]|uniref:hypothetical protein n=1 Tax=Paraburkholderia phenazinium TaxID=60549 RepID=UPI00158A7397|nr:hypothetical protein [Paraburkholderia phenazinium]